MKRIFSLVLATIFLFSLAACGKEAAPTQPSGTSAIGEQLNSQPTTEDATEQATEAPTEPAIIYIMTSKTRAQDGVVLDYEEYDTEGKLLKKIDGAPGTPGGYTYEYTYDENGNCTKKVYIENGFPPESTYYTFDEKGNMVKKDESRPLSELHYSYDYNDAGQMIKEQDTASNGGSTTFEYDSRGLMIRKSKYLHDANEPYEIREYDYDATGNKIKETSSNNGTPFEYYTWTYDANGNMTSELLGIYYDGENLEYKLASRWLYDEHGNLIGESDDPYNEEVTPHTRYTYNDAGQTLEKYNIQSDGSLVLALTYQYDENGLLATTTQHQKDGSTVIAEEYTYDENGNMLSSFSPLSNIKWVYTYAAIGNPNR